MDYSRLPTSVRIQKVLTILKNVQGQLDFLGRPPGPMTISQQLAEASEIVRSLQASSNDYTMEVD